MNRMEFGCSDADWIELDSFKVVFSDGFCFCCDQLSSTTT
jgi:hypothetical protein